MWDSILDVLKRKATQGVLVRVIYDDMGCFLTLPPDYAETLREYGIEAAVFSTFRPFLTVKQNNRDHRKIAVIDGRIAFTGGINLADEYINAVEKYGHWKDSAIRLPGHAAWSFALIFLQMWHLVTKQEEYLSKYRPAECESSVHDGFVQPYADSPTDDDNVGEHVYLQIINNANPICIYHFEKLGVYIYASTEPILKSTLKQLNMKLGKPTKIKVDCGEILKIDTEGHMSRSQFDDTNIFMGYSHWPRWCNVIPEVWEPANDPRDDYINDLKSVAAHYGIWPEEIDDLLNGA